MILFYEKTRLKRIDWRFCSVILQVLLLFAFWSFFEQYILGQEADMANAYEVIPVRVVVSNLRGTQTDGLNINGDTIDLFLSDRYVYRGERQSPPFSSYVKDVRVTASVYYSQGSGYSAGQKLSGISSAEASSELSGVSGSQVAYLDGYGNDIFEGSEDVCVVPASVMGELTPDPDGSYRISLSAQMRPIGAGAPTSEKTFQVVGTYESDSKTIYCPFHCVAQIQSVINGSVVGDSLSATVRNNYDLAEFRALLDRHFAKSDPSGGRTETEHLILRYHIYAITVHDDTLRDTVNALNRNLQSLYRLRPVFAVIELLISAAVGFIYIQLRRYELAVMRSLGAGKGQAFCLVLTEIGIMFVLGLLFSLIISLYLKNTGAVLTMATWIFLSMEAGAAAACLTAVSANGIRILREVE